MAFVYVPLSGTPADCRQVLGQPHGRFGRSSPPDPSLSRHGHLSPDDSRLFAQHGRADHLGRKGGSNNSDNVVSYQANGDSWDIQTRDLPNMRFAGTGAARTRRFLRVHPRPHAGRHRSPTGGLFRPESGTTASFTVKLDSPPTADVTIDLTSSNPGEGTVSPASLTFTAANWYQPQTVTVTGVDDAASTAAGLYDPDGAGGQQRPGYNGSTRRTSPCRTRTTRPAITVVRPASGLTTTEAGGSGTFTVVLEHAAHRRRGHRLSSSDLTEGTVSPASLTFTTANWNQIQTVTVTGVNDPQDDGDVAYTIVTAPAVSTDVSYNGFDPSDVSLTNTDNDAIGITLTPTTPLTTTEDGGTATFSLVLTSQPAADSPWRSCPATRPKAPWPRRA